MPLTAHQKEILEESLSILETSARLLITGEAGVGKTYMVNTLVHTLQGRIVCAAPTHKALSVLQDKVDKRGVEFKTIHSLLSYRSEVDKETLERIFVPRPNPDNPPLAGIKYLIVDEASMIGVEMLSYLEAFASKQKTVVIFVGDKRQINPVAEKFSPVFMGCPILNKEGLGYPHPTKENTWVEFTEYPTVTLTEITRQGQGNPIIRLSRNMHELFSYQAKHQDYSTGYFYTHNKPKIIENLVESNGSDLFKYIAWTNREVEMVNSETRRAIYGNPKKIEEKETLVFNAPYKQKYYTNQELFVDTVQEKTEEMEITLGNKGEKITQVFTLKYYIINPIRDTFGDLEGVFVIHEDSEKEFKKIAAILTKNVKNKILDWQVRETFLSKFADISYNHALTVHKSQGSTFKTVAVNVGNIMLNKDELERDRILYTAVTRPSELLILYNV